MKITRILVLLAMLSFSTFINAQDGTDPNRADTITMTINIDVSNSVGNIVVGLYDSNEQWLKEIYRGDMQKIVNNKVVTVFENLAKGEYALSIYHDENMNEELDRGMFGIPKEEYACSNNAKGRFGPPKWVDAVFVAEKTMNVTVTIK